MRREPKMRAWLVVILALLLAPLAMCSVFPIVGHLLAAQRTHVCQCAAQPGHAACTCPACEANALDRHVSETSVREGCGDESRVFGGSNGFAILPPPLSVCAVLPGANVREPLACDRMRDLARMPPTPPPRPSV